MEVRSTSFTTKNLTLIEDGPHIINPKSNFVFCTYWWGRGRTNRNFERPCPDQQNAGGITKGILFEKMKDLWIENMKKLNINYYIVEIPNFVGYTQRGINYKPKFILHCLDKINNRAVVYLDGDIVVHKYPYIFEMDNIDVMLYGWNNDSRRTSKQGGKSGQGKPCWDPFILELSGGIMYYANNEVARKILHWWILETKKIGNKGRADDRILSVMANRTNLKTWANVIELPKEFLWLPDLWSDTQMQQWGIKRKDIIVEHTACLTSEDRASSELGANRNRIPRQYFRLIEKHLDCIPENPLDEDVFLNIEWAYMNNKEQSKELQNINTVHEENKWQDTISYQHKWGPLTDRINKVKKEVDNIVLRLVFKNNNKKENKLIAFDTKKVLHYYSVDENMHLAKQILKLSEKYQHVIYLPKESKMTYINKLLNLDDNKLIEFSAKNINQSTERYRKAYLLQLDKNHPIYFSFISKSKMLKSFLLIWALYADQDYYRSLQNAWNSSIQNLWLIRNKW